MEPERTLTILILPEGKEGTRTLRIPYRHLRWYRRAAITIAILLLGLVGSWGYLAVRAGQARQLESRVSELLGREEQVVALARALDEVEEAYESLRSLFGTGPAGGPGEPWLPPPSGRPASGVGSAAPAEARPTSWPLTERGFVTQRLLEDDGGSEHPGIDIAVPQGSYIRAAGSGTVVEAAEDPVYGWYLVLDHGEGYRSLYAHALALLVSEGEVVRQNEVIALTGSSGRSTAPHLHFEILRDGEPVDPLGLVGQP